LSKCKTLLKNSTEDRSTAKTSTLIRNSYFYVSKNCNVHTLESYMHLFSKQTWLHYG